MDKPTLWARLLPADGSPTRQLPMAWPISMLAGALVVALAAQVAFPVPFSPVPMTLQGLAVILVGGVLGAAAGAGALVTYLVAGALGAPVFALGRSGLVQLLGPTGGYLLAFPIAAIIAGSVARRGAFGRCLLASLAAMAMIHLGGWAQLTLLSGQAGRSVALGVAPFVVQDLLKAALAALILWRAHHALRPNA